MFGSASQTSSFGSGVKRHLFSVKPLNKCNPIIEKYIITKTIGIKTDLNFKKLETYAENYNFKRGTSSINLNTLNNLIALIIKIKSLSSSKKINQVKIKAKKFTIFQTFLK